MTGMIHMLKENVFLKNDIKKQGVILKQIESGLKNSLKPKILSYVLLIQFCLIFFTD